MMRSRCRNRFLDNARFAEWYFSRSAEQEAYWQHYLETHPDEVSDFERAVELFSRLHFNEYELDDEAREKIWARVTLSVARRRFRRRLAVACSAAAAILVFVLVAVSPEKPGPDLQMSTLSPDTILGEVSPVEHIRLVSGSSVIELSESETLKVGTDGKLATRSQGNIEVASVELHQLIVPYGKRAVLTLSDGSRMWINSGSKVEFPLVFADTERSVRVNGEVYVEVTKEEARPFRIHSGDLSVTVLGTKFDISSYDDRSDKQVVLVEGCVEVSSHKGERRILKPNQMFRCDSLGQACVCSVDPGKYTSWKDGVFVFDQTPLPEVLDKISRYYNIRFRNNSSSLMQLSCTGRLYLPDNVDQVMNTIAVLSGTTYECKDNIIYINPKQKAHEEIDFDHSH